MAKGKYLRVKPKRKKRAILLLCLTMLLVFAISGTLAYVVASSSTVSNQFIPASVTCTVSEDFKVTNTGNVDAFVRAAVVANWTDDSGYILPSGPANPMSYLSFGSSWEKGTSDEFYYYNSVVTPTGDTKTTAALVTVSDVPAGYKLRVDMVAEAIQAEGMGADNAQDAWEIASGNDG